MTSVSYAISALANVESLTITGAVAVNATGNALANVLTGNGAANNLAGGAGNDTLTGGAGADTLVGGTGDDTYVVESASDVITATDSPKNVKTLLEIWLPVQM